MPLICQLMYIGHPLRLCVNDNLVLLPSSTVLRDVVYSEL